MASPHVILFGLPIFLGECNLKLNSKAAPEPMKGRASAISAEPADLLAPGIGMNIEGCGVRV